MVIPELNLENTQLVMFKDRMILSFCFIYSFIYSFDSIDNGDECCINFDDIYHVPK